MKREPKALAHLRDTLSHERALEEFRHHHEGEPGSDAELQAFVEDYVREAYADGVKDWTDLDRVAAPVFRRSMDGPFGRKLREAGFVSLWDYAERAGFSTLDKLKSHLRLETLTPLGFDSYVREVAQEDGKWTKAFRLLVAHHLNAARGRDRTSFITFLPISRIPADFPKQMKWLDGLCREVVRRASSDEAFLATDVSWDDPWLVELIAKRQAE